MRDCEPPFFDRMGEGKAEAALSQFRIRHRFPARYFAPPFSASERTSSSRGVTTAVW